MKKNSYTKPSLKWLEAEQEELMAGSPVESGFNTGNAPETDEVSGNLARKSTLWDDDEE